MTAVKLYIYNEVTAGDISLEGTDPAPRIIKNLALSLALAGDFSEK